jgi:hypothetical protein
MVLPFPTIGDELLFSELCVDLATTIYAKPEPQAKLLNHIHSAPKYNSLNTSYWTKETLPSTVQGVVELYFQQSITEKDRTEFLAIYKIPFMGTGKKLEDFYAINPAVFTPVLDALIQSKRIQRILSQPNTLDAIRNMFQFRGRILRDHAMEDFTAEAAELKESLSQAYEEQEIVIANHFLQAQQFEPRFLASENAMKAKITANAARRKRKTRRGGKRSLQKPRRYTRK